MNTFEKIYQQVRRIPKGKVATYGQIAALAGNPHWSRVVGYALHVNPDPATIKCHRVVNRFGGLSEAFAFGGQNEQARLLAEEGVELSADGTVDLKRYGVTPQELLPAD
ncbi:MAG: MGMT family protein [Clostridia bacterium]|nr:MGMT family protein [Clostridia bacterium]